MTLVDTHTHIYLSDFDADIATVLDRAYRNGVEHLFLPAIDSETHPRLLALAQQPVVANEPRIYPMMGLHPCSVTDTYEQELSIAYQHLTSGVRYAAVGEIGLDFHWDTSHSAAQYIAFERQIEWAIAMQLPIVIHSRKSTYECIAVLKKYKGKITGIFHCFSGSIEEANEIIKLGFVLGIGGVVTYKNAGLKEVVAQLDIAHLVLETDAPYLTPAPHRGQRNEPSYIKIMAQQIAQIKGMSYGEVASITTATALRVFGVSG